MLENLTHFSLSDNTSLSHTLITFTREGRERGREGGREGGGGREDKEEREREKRREGERVRRKALM